jgi:putative transcriptional regulator
MTCVQCGARMETRRENVRYDLVGLPNVTLVGVKVARCPECGEHETIIPNLEGLHRALASAVIRKPTALTGDEIRFLRKFLGWSGVDFARHIGATPETVSRWERGSAVMSSSADRLLRLMVVTGTRISDYSLEMLQSLRKTKAAATTIRASLVYPKPGTRTGQKKSAPMWTTKEAA